MAKQKFSRGGKAQGGKKARSGRKPGSTEKILGAALTCANLVLSLAVAVCNRREVIHAVQDSEDVRLLLTQRAHTEEK